MDGICGKPDQPEKRQLGVQKFTSGFGNPIKIDPPQSGNHRPLEFILLFNGSQHGIHAFRDLGFEGQDPSCEDFSRLSNLHGLPADLPTFVSGDSQPVDVGFNAVVQMRQVGEIVVGVGNGLVSKNQLNAAFSACCSIIDGDNGHINICVAGIKASL